MQTESTAELFHKIQKNSHFFDKAFAGGEKAKAKFYAEQCAELFCLLAKKVPLREHEYLMNAKEWKAKIMELEAIHLAGGMNAGINGNVIDRNSKKSPHVVFISYSNPDRKIAYSLCSYLESQGIMCWIAPRDILPGANYSASIIDGIDKSRIVILIFSKSSNTSSHVFRELEEALFKNIRILPFRIEDISPSEDMRYFINIPHWLDAFRDSPETYYDKLLGSVQSYLIPDTKIP
jgi:hypothetical protein